MESKDRVDINVEFDWSIQQCGTSRDVIIPDLTEEPADDKQCAVRQNAFGESDEDRKPSPSTDTERITKPKIKAAKPKRTNSGTTKSTLHECEKSSKVFEGTNIYQNSRKHMKLVHGNKHYTCKKCNKTFKCRRYLIRHKRHTKAHQNDAYRKKNQKGSYKCAECNSTFASNDSLGQHTHNLHETEIVTCDICKTSFKSKNYLRTHMSRVHYDDGKLHQCGLCQKTFRSPRYLRVHIKNSHTGSFVSIKDLDVLIEKDSVEERVQCKFCCKSLKSETSLDIHMKRKHAKKEQKKKEEKREETIKEREEVIKKEEPDEFEISVEEVRVGF